ncbi:19790_t:CDS:2, partial [Rhizophagus irregularis]
EDPFEKIFQLYLDTSKIQTIGLLKDAIITSQKLNVATKEVKLWRVDFPLIVRTLSGSKENLYIFVDDSNLYIEGKYVVAEYENMGSFDHERIQNGRTLGSDPIVVGSVPPADSLWDLVRAEGFHVKTFPRNDQGFEKMPVLETAVDLADSLELLCEKNTLGLSSKLFDPNNVSNPAFTSLNPYYKIITYGYGPEILYYGFNKMKILQLSGGEISNWKTKEMMRFFYDIGLFGWWYRERDLTWMYFKSSSDIRKAENYIRSKYYQTKFIRI